MKWSDMDSSERDVPRRSVSRGEHQITVILELLRILELNGCIITCDAIIFLNVVLKTDLILNLRITRALAMNLTHLEKTNKRGLQGRVKRADWDNFYLEKLLKI